MKIKNMTAKYTHKFIIYNKKRIRNNYKGLVEKLAEFDKEAIPKDFLENLTEISESFLKKRQEFYLKNSSKMCTIDEILPYKEEINVETNKVLAFVNKYVEFDSLIVGIDYFNGEDEYIEKYYSHEELGYLFPIPSNNLTIKLVLGYYYGIWGNKLDIFLKEIDLEDVI